MKCPLCFSATNLYHSSKQKRYFKCNNCHVICLHPDNYVNLSDERKRYEEHQNDVNDIRYQQFVKPIVNSVLADFSLRDKGLDFGCGTGPVITKLLLDSGFSISTYDPFFDKNPKVFNDAYNYIVCCEVIEHFHQPLKEFQLLKSLLKPSGKLYCMTEIYDENTDFQQWYYKNDDTHVIFYHRLSMEWIKKHLGFSKVVIRGRLIVFEI